MEELSASAGAATEAVTEIFRLTAGQAFPQPDHLRPQLLAGEFALESNHVLARLAGAQLGQGGPLLVAASDLNISPVAGSARPARTERTGGRAD